MNDTDTDLINWMETAGAQVWQNKQSKRWTCSVLHPSGRGRGLIQPSNVDWRQAVSEAKQVWTRVQRTVQP